MLRFYGSLACGPKRERSRVLGREGLGSRKIEPGLKVSNSEKQFLTGYMSLSARI